MTTPPASAWDTLSFAGTQPLGAVSTRLGAALSARRERQSKQRRHGGQQHSHPRPAVARPADTARGGTARGSTAGSRTACSHDHMILFDFNRQAASRNAAVARRSARYPGYMPITQADRAAERRRVKLGDIRQQVTNGSADDPQDDGGGAQLYPPRPATGRRSSGRRR